MGLASAAFLLAACAPPRPPRGISPEQIFQWSQDHFDRRKYGASVTGFRDFLVRDPLSPLADSAQFMVGESYLRDGQELLAITEFERMVQTRPGSELADDAQFGLCRAQWQLSPKVQLEQEHTRLTVQECRRLVQFFGGSPWVPRATEMTREAQNKLAEKAYRVGRYYFKRKLYESANIYFERALAEAPDGPIVPEVLRSLYLSYRRVGFDAEAEQIRRRLLQDFPDTEAARVLRDRGAPSGA